MDLLWTLTIISLLILLLSFLYLPYRLRRTGKALEVIAERMKGELELIQPGDVRIELTEKEAKSLEWLLIGLLGDEDYDVEVGHVEDIYESIFGPYGGPKE